MFSIGDEKKLFTITNSEPKKYQLPDHLVEYPDHNVYFELSQTGKYIYTASEKLICLYNSLQQKPILKYYWQEKDRDLNETLP